MIETIKTVFIQRAVDDGHRIASVIQSTGLDLLRYPGRIKGGGGGIARPYAVAYAVNLGTKAL